MALFAKSKSDILTSVLTDLKNNTQLSMVGPGSKVRAISEIFSSELANAYSTFDQNTAATLVYGSSGVYLDYLGDLVGIVRRKSSRADASAESKIIKFYTLFNNFGEINNNASIVIPSGTTVWALRGDSKVEFVTVGETTLNALENEGYASVMSSGFGSDFNVSAGAIKYHDFTGYTEYRTGALLVANTISIDNASNDESDDSLRYRIINSGLSRAMANEVSVKMAALNVPGVADVALIPFKNGIGTVTVLVKTTTQIASQETLAAVSQAVNAVSAYGIKAIAEAPEYLYMKFQFSVAYKSDVSALEQNVLAINIAKIISDYVNNLDIGETFYINELYVRILTSDNRLRTKTTESKLTCYVDGKMLASDFTPSSTQKLTMAADSPVQVNSPSSGLIQEEIPGGDS